MVLRLKAPPPRYSDEHTLSNHPPPLDTERDTDSDSDLSLEDDQSGSYASTHSSDSEEDEEFPREPCWENLLCPNNEKLPAHSTPKGNAGDGLLSLFIYFIHLYRP